MPPSSNLESMTLCEPLSRTLVYATLFAATLLGTADEARAYSVQLTDNTSGSALHWKTKPIPFSLNPACAPSVPLASCLQTLRDSFQAWVGAPCSSLAFVEIAQSTNLNLTATGSATNGLNELAWIGNQWPYGQSVLGVTAPVFYSSGEIIEADIAFNAANVGWTLSGAFGGTDVMSVAVHEIGHLFGLGHVLDGNSMAQVPTMAPAIDSSLGQRTPEADELLGTCFLAPAGDFACGSNNDCPMVVASGGQGEYYLGQSACDGGTCSGSIAFGSSNDGAPCNDHSQCTSNLCVNDGKGVFCRQPCWDEYPCAGGFFCEPLQGVPFGACLPNGYLEDGPQEPPPAEEEEPLEETSDIGQPCLSNQECDSGICAGQAGDFVCTVPCAGDADCPAEWSCSSIGAGVSLCLPFVEEPEQPAEEPQQPANSSLADGEPCSSDEECAGGVCQFSFCTRECHVIEEPSSCQAGMACLRSAEDDGAGLCIPRGSTFAGDPCSDDSQCYTLLCYAGVCRASCDPSAPSSCPFEQGCWPLGDLGYCADGTPEPSAPTGTEPPSSDPGPGAPEESADNANGQPFWPNPNSGKADQGWGDPAEAPNYTEEEEGLGCAAGQGTDLRIALLALLFILFARIRRISTTAKEHRHEHEA